MTEAGKIMHEPGECPTDHKECSGAGFFAPDPFMSDVWGDQTKVWLCEGERIEKAMDI